MSHSSYVAGLRGWSSVGRWTLFGTLACVFASVTLTALTLADLGPDVIGRVMFSATVLPIILGTPLFFFFSVRIRELSIANARLGRVARTDSLTACLNRGAFTAKVDDWLHQSVPDTGALLMIDADNFKAINDEYGHDVGDEALTLIARSIRTVLRSGDIVGRMGGEEFGVFLPGVSHAQALLIAERIREAVNGANFAPDGRQRELTVSIGGAVFGARRTSFSELFRIADQRLYGAKQGGRNRATIVHVQDYPAVELRQSA